MNSAQVLSTLESMANACLTSIQSSNTTLRSIAEDELLRRVVFERSEWRGNVMIGMLKIVISQLKSACLESHLSDIEVVKNYIESSKDGMSQIQSRSESSKEYETLLDIARLYISTCTVLGYSIDAPVGNVLKSATEKLSSFQDKAAIEMFVKLGIVVNRVSKLHKTTDTDKIYSLIQPHLHAMLK